MAAWTNGLIHYCLILWADQSGVFSLDLNKYLVLLVRSFRVPFYRVSFARDVLNERNDSWRHQFVETAED